MEVRYLLKNQVDINKWDSLVNDAETGNVFMQSFYLDLVCNKEWAVFVIEKDSKYIAGLPVFPIKKWGMQTSRQPIFSKYWSVMQISATTGQYNYTHNWKKVNQIFYQEIDKVFKWYKHFSVLNMPYSQQLNFIDAFAVYPKYSQCIALADKSMDEIRTEYAKQTRKRIRKLNEQGFEVKVSNSSKNIQEVLVANEQNDKAIISSNLANKAYAIIDACLDLKKGFALHIQSNEGKLAAAGFFLQDAKRTYFLNGYVMPSFRQDGVMNLLVDAALEKSMENSIEFDFYGSQIESIEAFFRSFGTQTQLYFSIEKANFPFNLLK